MVPSLTLIEQRRWYLCRQCRKTRGKTLPTLHTYHARSFTFSSPPQQMYTSSVDIRPDWRVLEQVNFSALTKLSLSVDEPEDLAFCGSLWHYDKTYDRLTAKNTKRLEKTQRVFAAPTSSEDPMLMCVHWCTLFFFLAALGFDWFPGSAMGGGSNNHIARVVHGCRIQSPLGIYLI